MKLVQLFRGRRSSASTARPTRLAPAAEPLESRRLLSFVAEVDLFGPAQTVHASSTDARPDFTARNLFDGTSAAFLFGGGAVPQRIAVSHFNAAVHTLRFFDTPSYTDRAPPSVTVYHSPLEQLSLTPASYVRLGTYTLPTADTGGSSQGDVYLTPTRPADHPRATDPTVNPADTVHYAEVNGLTVPPGTRSLLLDFGINPAGLGFGLAEIQALGYPSADRPADPTLLAWGRNVYDKTVASLKVPGSNLFAETAALNGTRSGGNGGFAYVWPAATQFRVLNALARLDPATYRPVLRAYSDELHTRYWRNSGAGGYRSGVGSNTGIFYDDNGHLAVSLAEAFHLTGDPVYLSRAVQTYNFVMSGEDSAGGGGIYFEENDRTSKDAVSTLQGARAGLMLHQLTGTQRYLDDATRLYAWANTHIREGPIGLFVERYRLVAPNANQPEGVTLINSNGIALSLNLLLYDVTGNAAHLRDAQRLGRLTIPRYFNESTGAINDEGYWAFELVTALADLHLRDHNPAWISAVRRAMTWLHDNREDPRGHYGTLWARDPYFPGAVRPTWNLNEQAAVAVSYLYTAAVDTVAPPFVTAPGDPVVGFHGATVGGDATPSSAGTGAGQFPAAEAPARAVDRDPATKYLNYGNGSSTVSNLTKGVGTGFVVTPALGPSIVTGVQVATANDRPGRDPITVSVEGTNATTNLDSGAAWTLIANDVNLGIGPELTRQSFGPIVRFANTTAYRSYRVIIKSHRVAENGVAYSELNLVGAYAAAAGHAVVGRRAFYNNSVDDTPSPTRPDANDDAAIATDKAALLPGASATFANVTSYSRGLNGIMVDLAGLPAALAPTAADFRVEVLSVGEWVALPAGPAVSVRRGAGASGADRVTLVLPDYAARNTWLKITTLVSLRTGLTSPDVFYFGNLVGDAGGPGTPTVNAMDLARTRTAAALGPVAPAAFDFNRDGLVNALDVALVRNNQRRTLPPLTAPASPATARAAAAVFSDVAPPVADNSARRTRPATRDLLDTSAADL